MFRLAASLLRQLRAYVSSHESNSTILYLTIADELAQLIPISLDSGGFVFTIEVKAPLLIGTRLKIVYTDAEDMTLVTSRLSKASYFNTTETNYIAFSDEVPYDRFLVKAGLVHENIEGLLFGDDNVYSKCQ